MATYIAMTAEGTVIDHFGNEIDIPKHKARLLRKDPTFALRMITTRNGQTQYRSATREEFDTRLRENALPLQALDNIQDEAQVDVEEFLAAAEALKPADLVIKPLKWRYLMRSVLRGKNIMMTGPSGTGKTLSVQSVATALDGRDFFYFNLGATQDPRSALVGNTHFSAEEGTFVADSHFVHAIQTPNAIVLLDELTRANPDAWNILMSVLDENQRYLRIDERPDTPTIRVAPGVTFIATANIGSEYTATRVLDRALLDRFPAIVEMEYMSEEEELGLLKAKFPDVAEEHLRAVVEIAGTTRTQVASDDPRVTTAISSRVTVEMAGLLHDGFSLEEVAEVSVFPFYSDAGGTDSERTFMKQVVQRYIDTGAPDDLF